MRGLPVHGSWARLAVLGLSLAEPPPPPGDPGHAQDLSRGLHSYKTPAQGAGGADSMSLLLKDPLLRFSWTPGWSQSN